MQKQNSNNLPKLIIIITIILLIGTLFGVVSFYLTGDNKIVDDQLKRQQVNLEKLSDDKISNNFEDDNIKNKTDISDWKTYRNEKYGFELKYPTSWKFYSNSNQFAAIASYNLYDSQQRISNNSGVVIEIKIETLNQLTLFESLKNEDNYYFDGLSEISLNGYDAYKLSMYYTDFYFLNNKNEKIRIDIIVRNSHSNKNANFIGDQILSTFKFIEKNEMIKISGNEYIGYVYLKDNVIYHDDKIRGFLADDKINIYIGDEILSFEGNIKKLSFGIAEVMDWNFYYDTLEISNIFRGPYAIYEKTDMNKISYKCDGSLLITFNGQQLPNYYCETNGKNFLSQYEFSAANGNGFATGGGYSESWYKLYIKKINGINYTFSSRLIGDTTDSDDKYSNVKKYNEDYQYLSSKKYLDEILMNEKNKRKIGEWDEFVKKITFTEKDKETFSCGDSIITDIDGNIYNTVKIGDQCWMKENLKVTKNPQGEKITRYCYDNNESICEIEGGLYDWDTAMDGSVDEGAQGICPSGWHLPKDEEWHEIENNLATGDCDANRSVLNHSEWGCDVAGTELKRGGSIGFEGLFAGYRHPNGSFAVRGANAIFWSSTANNYNAWYRNLYSERSTIRRDAYGKTGSYSVRCLKD